MTEEMSYRGINVHSLMILRDNKVACEAWSKPLTPEMTHMVYSISKSFLATAYGFALDEGKISRETKLIDVFPEVSKKQDAFLEKLPEVMESGGRIAILTFHSGEDRMVKKSFKALQKAGVYREVASEVIRPSAEECVRNSRARSTKMRWAVKA